MAMPQFMTAGIDIVYKRNGQIIANLLSGWKWISEHEVVVGITEKTNGSRASGGGDQTGGNTQTGAEAGNGAFGNSKSDGSGGIGNADLLYLHTYGSPVNNIPARPVLEPAISQTEVATQIAEHLKSGMKKAIVGGDAKGAEAEYSRAGMIAQSECRKYIIDSSHFVPNAPMTIERKGSSKPLIDTGSMMNAITYEVREKT